MTPERKRLERTLRRARTEWQALTTILAVAVATWLFLEIADEVVEGSARPYDRALLLLLRAPGDPTDPLGPAWLEEAMRDLTALGGVTVLTLVTLVAIGYTALARRWRLTITLAVAVVGGTLASQAIKALIDRARPELAPAWMHVTSASFPSGHAMMAATVYLTLAALLMRFRSRNAAKLYILGVAALVTVLVGVSRVYLGVHWPTDVVAGWAVGAAWALLVWGTAQWLQAHGRPLHGA